MPRRLLATAGVVALTAVGLSVLAPQAAAAPGVDPNSVEVTLEPGESTTIGATVTTPPLVPHPDIVFLADTTGSMQPVLANVSQNIRRIIDEVRAVQPTARFAVTEYKEQANSRAFHVNTPLTDDEELVAAGINDWLVNVGGGGAPWTDFINAHWQIGNDPVGFRPNGTRVVAWFGDARSHDPSMGHTLQDAINAEAANRVRVVAVPVEDTTGGGLDALGQASAITAGTGGLLVPTTAPNAVAQALLDGIRALDVTVTPTVTSCAPELTVATSPASQRVPSGADAAFQETIGVREGTPGGDYQCTVDFRVGGVSAGYTQAITVHVPGTPPPVPNASIGDVRVIEGNMGTTPATFQVSLDVPAPREVRINWTTRDGTALSTSDYSPAAGELVIPPGATTGSIPVTVIGDRQVEPDETYAVELTAATGATIVDPRGAGTIVNDDDGGPDPDLPVASVGDASVPEGGAGAAPATLTVTLSHQSVEPISVPWTATTGTTATPGEDFTVSQGTVEFAPGSTSGQLEVPVLGDLLDEPDEQFTVQLGTPAGATVGDGTGTVTIVDDDEDGGGGDPVVSIGDATVSEGNTGTTPATFAVTLSEQSDSPVTVVWGTRDGTAVAPGDYTQAGGEVRFEPGQTSQNVDVDVVGDEAVEADETFAVELTGATGAAIADNSGTGTIADDDDDPVPTDPTVSLGDASVTEGDTGTTAVVFTATLDQVSEQDVTVPWVTTTDGTATPGEDFTESFGDLTIPAGQTSAQLEVAVTGDTADEPDETFEVALGTPAGAVVGDGTGVGTIIDDDDEPGPRPVASIDDTLVAEGDSGTSAARFTVRLDTAATERLTVGWRTDDGTATTPADYTGGTGEVVFEAGDVSGTLEVPVVGDTAVEPDETFTVTLTGGTTIGDGTATGTIDDDDGNGGGDGVFTCTANALTLLGARPAVANPGFDPCVADDATAAKVRLGLGLLTVRASGLTATTDATATAASATGGLLTTRISTIGLTIEVSAITSTATASCADGEAVLAGSSSIAELKINGVRIPIGSGPVTIPLVVGSLSLNSTVVDGDTVTQRALALDTLLGDVVVGETRAGTRDNPC